MAGILTRLLTKPFAAAVLPAERTVAPVESDAQTVAVAESDGANPAPAPVEELTLGNGGGGPIEWPFDVSITSPPAAGIWINPGPLTVTGTATSLKGYSLKSLQVEVVLNGATQWQGTAQLTPGGAATTDWAVTIPDLANVQPPSTTYGISAWAEIQSDGSPVASATAGAMVTVSEFTLTVTSLPVSPTVHYDLDVTADADYGVQSLQWKLDSGQEWQQITELSSGAFGQGTTVTASIPLVLTDVTINGTPVSNGSPEADGARLTVDLQAERVTPATPPGQTPPPGPAPPTTVPLSFTVTWRDHSAPTVTWIDPQDGTALEALGTSTEAQTTVLAVISDEDNDAVSAGIPTPLIRTAAGAPSKGVWCTLDGGTTIALVPDADADTGGTNNWSAPVTVPSLGPHTLRLDAVDVAGNSAVFQDQTRQVAVRQSGIQGITEQDYLADLVDYVRNRLLTKDWPAVANPHPNVTAWHLERALSQPFRRLAGAGTARAGTTAALAPINAVRGGIEVLRSYLAAAPPAPVAHWPLDEGTGTVVRDDTGGGSTGTLASSQTITWGPGPLGAGAAPVFQAAASTHMSVAPTPQLACSVDRSAGNAVSIAAWINPTAIGPGASVIVAFDQWCGLALGPDLTLQLLPANATSGVAPLFDSGVAVALNDWSHVALYYDGTIIETFVNGIPRGTQIVASLAGIQPSAGAGSCVVGASTADQLFFQGAIAQVGVYDVPLTTADASLLAGQATNTDPLAGAVSDSGYLPAVYEAILVALGTTSEELRAATRADSTTRSQLAARLGIALEQSRPDQLDQLLLTPSGTQASALNEANLESLFGLQPTDADPLAPPTGMPLLAQWQDSALRSSWATQDAASTSSTDFSPPIIDPDVVFAGDVSNQSDPMGEEALSLIAQRSAWLTTQTQALAQPSAGTGLPALITSALGTDLTSSAATSLASLSAQGYDITAQLGQVPIAVDAFDRLVTLSALPDALYDYEWGDATAIIVEVLKTRQFPAWREQEQTQKLLLDPAIFTAQALPPDQLPAWRGSWSARVAWQDRLAARQDQLADIDGALAAALTTAEQAALPILRDAALALAAPGAADGTEWPSPADQLGLSLCIDLQVGPQLTTTRVEQAANALQVLLTGIDSTTGGLAELASSFLTLPWTVDQNSVSGDTTASTWFDRLQGELSWMGSYSTWLSAMTVFLCPENYLLPSTRTTISPQFQNFISSVTAASPPTSAQAAHAAAASYWDDPAWWQLPKPQGMPASPPGNLPPHGADQTPAPGSASLTATALTSGGTLPPATYQYEVVAISANGQTTPTVLASAATTGSTGSVALTWETVTDAVSYNVYGRTPGALVQLAWIAAGQPLQWTDTGTPVGSSPYPYTEQLSSGQLDQLQISEAKLASPTTYREVYFDLPLQLALSLSDAGQWEAALDWLQIIYDRDRLSSERWNFPMSQIDSGTDATITRDENEWLAGGQLDPHYLASTRSSCYQRFTLMTVAGVLCDWADAQFTLDTDESRAEASSLYVQALEVLQTVQSTYPTAPTGLTATPSATGGTLSAGTYTYEVTAVNTSGETLPSTPATATTAGSTGSVTLAWEPDAAAVSYKIYGRSPGSLGLLATVQSPTGNGPGSLTWTDSGSGSPGPPPPSSSTAQVPFIDQNPQLVALTGRATTALAQLRAGLNIAGMARPLADTDSDAPAVPPATNFRYATLIARAQQLVTSAAQIEASYLASLQQEDNENYQQLLAGQDLSVATAQVTIAYDQATVASKQVNVAQLQVQKAQIQSDTYAQWIAAGPNSFEQDQLAQLGQQSQWQNYASGAQAAAAVAQAAAAICDLSKNITSFGGAVAANVAAGAAGVANAVFTDNEQQAAIQGQKDALQASWERRSQEWSLQQQLANTDVAIGNQQVTIAQQQVTIAQQQAQVASLNQSNAQAKLQFLQTKFTNAQLYTWMAGVLSGVYRYFLQQAAAVARLAEQQLAFERQVPVPGYIKSDYWSPPTGGSDSPIGAGGIPTTGTGGLTGSARLLQDTTELDQYALDTEQRKLQLTQTFSLASIAPVDLQRFRQTGVLPFTVPLSSYGTPGMYLATIRAVRISIAALIPPAQGVRGALTSGGTSHIVVQNGDSFQTVALARPPETIALTSPANASGVFQVDLTPELLLPFEGSGLDLPFQLELPQAINLFDYRTIADVQVSIDYTALYSPDYATQVIRQLPATTSNSILLSLRDFPDAWYALVAQAQQLAAATPNGAGATPSTPPVLVASWQLTADYLPPNLSDPTVAQLTLMISRSGSVPSQFSIDHLALNGVPSPTEEPNPTGTVTIDDIVSTRNESGSSAWGQFTNSSLSPVGTWELGLVGNSDTISGIAGGDVQDIALVIGYTANLPAWPS